jgi:hypothetical protein
MSEDGVTPEIHEYGSLPQIRLQASSVNYLYYVVFVVYGSDVYYLNYYGERNVEYCEE